MSSNRMTRTPSPSSPASPARPGRTMAACLALAAAVILAPGTVQAQFFPPDPPVQVFSEDFTTGIDLGVWSVWPSGSGNWQAYTTPPWCFDSNHWDTHVRETGALATDPTGLVILESMPGNPGYNPLDWENIRIEFDLFSSNVGQMGIGWGLQPDTNGDGYPDSAYLFYIEDFADDDLPPGPDNRATWYLVRREADVNTLVGQGQVILDPGDDRMDSLYAWRCYRMRVDFYCGNLRVQVRRETFGSSWCQTGCYDGCGAGCSDASPEDCWCTIVEWTEPSTVLTPGGVSLYHGSPNQWWVGEGRWDNVEVSSWGPDCAICTDWLPLTGWTSDWDATTTGEGTDVIPFKIISEALLEGYSPSNDVENAGRIDVNASNDNDLKCGRVAGSEWDLKVDLPPPTAPTGSNVTELESYLETTATAVSASDMFTFSPDFDADNPIPVLTHGATPIAQTLKAAYDWYAATRGEGGAWDDTHDQAAQCRLWYLIFITDGEESCASEFQSDTGYADVCEWLQSAPESFANPGEGLDKVPIFTIGFSAGVGADSPLRCMSDLTDGDFKTAADAAELSAVLYDVINRMPEKNRSFLPVTVSPPPTTLGSGLTSDFLMTIPVFVPQNGESVWNGHLYGFLINPDNPTPPLNSDDELDTSAAEWDARDAIATQMTDGTGRNIFYTRGTAGSWQRTELDDIKTSDPLRDEFITWLDWPGGVTYPEANTVVDFVAATGGGRTSVLGDIFHSQPAIVGPPNNFRYYLNNVHDYYSDFMGPQQFRRRVAFAGSNDGLFHAFDAGFYDRDDGGTWDDTFDLGTGVELFSHVPRAVMNRLYAMTFGEEQQYMVDGMITTGDVYIDPSASGSPEWRTMAVYTLRRGGRGVVALDVTQPDPIPSGGGVPTLSTLPGCTDGSTAGCDGDYPTILWEFNAEDDTDENGDLEPDLGWTWSQPAIARVKADGGDDMFVVFFGGGWDRTASGTVGTFLYGLDAATGSIIYKQNIGTAVPGGMAPLDENDDGFVDRIYFGDTNGGLWRLDVTAEATMSGGRVDNWDLTKIYQFGPVTLSDGTTAPLEFYMKPKLVPAVFGSSGYIWGLAIGTGNRADIGAEDGVPNRFYFVLDVGQDFAYTESDGVLTGIDYDAPNLDDDQSFLEPGDGNLGWYLILRENEKVNTDAIVANEIVQFATFEPTGIAAEPAETPTGTPTEQAAICHAVGIGRLYQVAYHNANAIGDDRGTDLGGGLIAGGSDYTLGDTTLSWWTFWETGGTETELGTYRYHRVTNWRQE